MADMMIPEGWRISKIGDTCHILDSKRIPLNSQERATRQGAYPYYGANGIQGYIDDFIFEGEHVLLAEDGGYFDEWDSRPISYLVNGKFWVNNHAHILRAKKGHETKYVHYILVHKNILKHINGGTRAKLNQSDMREIAYLTPPLPEQQKIATILTSVDTVIEKTRAQIDKLKHLKIGMMQQLLTQGIGHTEFKDSPIGRIPKTWVITQISEVCSDIIDCVNKTAPVVDQVTPYRMIRTTNVRDGSIIMDGMRYVNEETYETWSRRISLRDGDIIFTREAPVGECGILKNSKNLFLGQRTMVYRADESKINNLFLLATMQSEYFKSQIDDLSGGSTTPHLRVPDCSKILLKIPSIEEQEKIANILQSIDTNIMTANRKLASLGKSKKAMMQDLLTGKVRTK